MSGAVTGEATEDGSLSTLNALLHASDVDDGSSLSVVNLPESLPAGVTYNVETHSFTLDPSHAAYQALGAGTPTTVTVDYGVTDGVSTTAASVSWTVTGIADGHEIPVNGSGFYHGTAAKDYFVFDSGISSFSVELLGFDASEDVIVFDNLGPLPSPTVFHHSEESQSFYTFFWNGGEGLNAEGGEVYADHFGLLLIFFCTRMA